MNENEQSCREVQDSSRHVHHCTVGTPEGEERGRGTGNLESKMGNKFSKLMPYLYIAKEFNIVQVEIRQRNSKIDLSY